MCRKQRRPFHCHCSYNDLTVAQHSNVRRIFFFLFWHTPIGVRSAIFRQKTANRLNWTELQFVSSRTAANQLRHPDARDQSLTRRVTGSTRSVQFSSSAVNTRLRTTFISVQRASVVGWRACSWRWFSWSAAISPTSCGRSKSPNRGLTVCLKNTSTRSVISLHPLALGGVYPPPYDGHPPAINTPWLHWLVIRLADCRSHGWSVSLSLATPALSEICHK